MGIGAGIVLIAIGAILRFALTPDAQVNPVVNLGVVGVILMIVGVLGVILDLAVLMPRRRRTVDEPRTTYQQYPDDPYRR
ncbi:hypothetical protein GCM10027047_38180 [Rhodococcus aerolatus]